MGLEHDGDRRPRGSFRSRGDAALTILLLTAFALLLRLPYLGDANADIDEQLYSLIGNAILHGQLPYVDLWDRKPFGLFLLYAFAHAVGGPSPLAYQLLGAGFAVLGALLTRHLALLLVDRTIATGSGVLYLILMTLYGAHSGQSELFHVPAMLAMAILVRDPDHPHALRRALIAMAIGGLALQVKYTVLPQCAFFGLWALWGDWRRHGQLPRLVKLAATFAILGLLPTVLVGLFYLVIGEWQAFWFANFVSFFLRQPAEMGRNVLNFRLFLMPLITLVLLGLYGRFRVGLFRGNGTYRYFWAMLAASAATVFLPSTIYAYYFAALIPAAILVALSVFGARRPWGPLAMASMALLLGFLVYFPTRMESSRETRAGMAQLVETVAPLVDDKDRCLWVHDGPTALYEQSGSCLPTRFIYPDHLNNALERDALGMRQIDEVNRILRHRPPAIVTADTPYTEQNAEVLALVHETIRQHYVLAQRAKLQARTISVWKRRDAAVGAP